MKYYVSILVMTLAVCSTQAGQESHGGNVVNCGGISVFTLDYYNAALPTVGGPADIVDLQNWSQSQVVEFIRSRLKNPLFLELFDNAMDKFGPITDWPLAGLKDVNDGGEPYFLPSHCNRMTAAVRQSNTIYVDPDVYSYLNEAQRGILYVHEMLYYISGQNSSTPIREMLRTFLKNNPSEKELIKATQLVGPYYDYQFFNRQLNYQLDYPNYGKQVVSIMGTTEKKDYLSVSISSSQAGQSLISNYNSWLDCRSKTNCKIELSLFFNGKYNNSTCEVTFPSISEMQFFCKNIEGLQGHINLFLIN